MLVKEIIEATHGKLLSGDKDYDVKRFIHDSRDIQENDMYIPLIGERVDGHQFIEQAFDKGASTIITSVEVDYPHKNVILVEDTQQALKDMAEYLRVHRNMKVVGITGSVGKTSTKDMISSVVSMKYKTLKTLGNFNSVIGLPLTMLRYQDEEVLVLEMGMNHLGEIHQLSMVAKPDVSVITNVGTAHIGELGSRENILKAKLEIIDGMNEDGILIINNDNDMLHCLKQQSCQVFRIGLNNHSDLTIKNIDLKEGESYFDIVHQGCLYHVHVPVSGEHFVYNALLSIAVGLSLNIDIEQCIQGIEQFELTKNRMDVISLSDDIKVIDGSYNANLDSMKSSLDVLSQYRGRKIAIFADMLELGEYEQSLHESVGEYVVEKNIDILLCVGKASQYIVKKAQSMGFEQAYCFEDNYSLCHYLDELVESHDVLLIKGSNGMNLKEVVEYLKGRKKMKKLLVICGGQSSEHIVSRMSCTSVLKNINKEKYEMTLIGIDLDGSWHILNQDQDDLSQKTWLDSSKEVHDIFTLIKQHDVVFPVLHGLYGEDGTIQGMLEMTGIPYVGCRVLGSSVSMDKIYTKKILEMANIPQVKSLYIKKRYDNQLVVVDEMTQESTDIIQVVKEKLGFPCFIKASRSGSSLGCYRCDEEKDLMRLLQEASKYDRHIVVEECIDCIELETAVLGNDDPLVSRVGQIMPHGEFYTFESKYEDEESKTCIPALVDADIQERIREYALRAFKAVDGHGLSRVDFFLDKKTGKVYLNEINTMPGFTKISMYPQLMADYGISYTELIDQLIEFAFEK
jgi:UDP-N-acetylmuramoyl-tripeptide--D-alanyl-D-alanine ligase/D-alanine--D-alanine ligase